MWVPRGKATNDHSEALVLSQSITNPPVFHKNAAIFGAYIQWEILLPFRMARNILNKYTLVLTCHPNVV